MKMNIFEPIPQIVLIGFAVEYVTDFHAHRTLIGR